MSQDKPLPIWLKVSIGCCLFVVLIVGGCTAATFFAVKSISSGIKVVDNQEAARLIQPWEPLIAEAVQAAPSPITAGAALEKLQLPGIIHLKIKSGDEAPITIKALPPNHQHSSKVLNGYGTGRLNELELLCLQKDFPLADGRILEVTAEFDKVQLAAAPAPAYDQKAPSPASR